MEKEIVHDLFEIVEVPRAYFTISQPKLEISKSIHDAIQNGKESGVGSLRNIEKRLKELYAGEEKTPHRNSIIKITSADNYTIDNLLMVLDALGKKIVVVDRTEEENEIIEKRGRK